MDTARKIRIALRSPRGLLHALGHVARRGWPGRLEQRCLRGFAFKPGLITVNVTARCNLRCSMCMQPRDNTAGGASPTLARQPEMTPAQWIRFIDQVAATRPAFYFSGGEPLLYRGIESLLADIKGRGLIAALVTNGTLLERAAPDLVRIGVDNVTVSIDGPREVHDAVRGVPGAFDRAVSGIRALREARRAAGAAFPAVKINCVITPDTLDTLPAVLELARSLGVDELSLQHPMFDTAENVDLHNRLFSEAFPAARPAGADSPADLSKRPGEFYEGRLAPARFDRLETILAEMQKDPGGRPRLRFFPKMPPRLWRPYYLDLDHPFPQRCSAPWSSMRLLADGTFEPCLHHAIGNVLDTHPWELWNCPAMRAFRRRLAAGRLFPACARCCYRCYA